MPSTGKHLKFATHHLEATSAMSTRPATRSWAAVSLFYAARDVAHAVFAIAPGLHEPFRHPTNHTRAELHDPGTGFVIMRHFSAIRTPYDDLYANSLGVRYEGLQVDSDLLDGLVTDFRDVCAWGYAEMSATGYSHFPVWLEKGSLPEN